MEIKELLQWRVEECEFDELKEKWHSVYVGYAAVRSVSVALDDEWMDDDETLDEDLDDWDASFFACGAFSGELPWAQTSNCKKRLEFWEWYIEEAVPKAYSATT